MDSSSLLTSSLKNSFTRINILCQPNSTSLICNDNKIVFDKNCYVRKDGDWIPTEVANQSEFIGYVLYEKYKLDIEKLNQEIEKLNREIGSLKQGNKKKINGIITNF